MKKILLILSLILIAYNFCNSQHWVRAGGMSDYIFSLAVKDNLVFALLNKDGLFSSSDNGKSWTHLGFAYDMSLGIGWGVKPKIQVNNDKIYVGIYQYGLFVSSDNGKSWSKINTPYKNVFNFIVDDDNIFISMGNREYISNDNGNSWQEASTGCEECIYCLAMKDSNIYAGNDWGYLYISSNYGKTWIKIYKDLPGNELLSIATIGDTIYLGTERYGIFKSTDKGQNWTDINNGLTYFKINSIVIDGTNIFAGTNGKGIFLSTDGGELWTRLNNDYAEEYSDINSIAVINNNIFAGGNSELQVSTDFGKNWEIINNGVSGQVSFLLSDKSNVLASTGEGLYLSTNHGLSWSHISKDFFRRDIFSTRVSAINSVGDKLFVGIRFRGIYSSTNNGITWEVQSNGIPESACVETFAVNKGIIYAGLESDGIYVSSDSGKNWFYVNNIFPYGITVYSITFKDSLIIAGTAEGIYLSTDNGINWSQSGKEIYDKVIYSLIVKDNYILAGTKDIGILLSTDNGLTWSTSNIGISEPSIISFAVCGNYIYAGTDGGVYYTSNNGRMWIQKIKGLKSYDIQSLLTIGDTVIAMTDTTGLFFTTNKSDSWKFIKGIGGSTLYNFKNAIYLGGFDGVDKSSDFGKTWIDLDSGLYKKEYESFWDDVAIEDTNIIIVDDYHNFFHSTNLGKNWSLVNNGIKDYVYNLELHNNILYISTVKGFNKSTDFGHTMIKSDKGLVDSSLGYFSIDDDKILISANSKLFLSMDNAQSWTFLKDFSDTTISSLAIDGNHIYIGTEYYGLYISTDYGQSWTDLRRMYNFGIIYTLAAKGSDVFIGSYAVGVHYSSDYGQSWKEVNSGIWDFFYNDACIYDIAISDDNYAYTSPHSNGVYRLNIDEITNVYDKQIETNDSFSLYPNPSSDYVFIKCRDGALNHNIKIYDILGNAVWQGIIKGESMRIDVSSFPVGVYFLQVNGSTKMFVRN
ncbi:MAG: hypothetical protein A2X61_00620 [Ignavibacteria bacterium GWB2_35_12]|nr:MAG: hypothetical protein A2X61_00620 [Ignavibacteria bacterium GWB2_35_12]OGU85743.1 MAG: hypothetical protein A2220_03180 [Ignavibacteria bacterium RIFOXYA2_FULL_35_10]OGV19153.1 MAG: hypothetical protein A2475_00035 [Ignavibacteria bacterium RIFOXYC2_FULL_35_21]